MRMRQCSCGGIVRARSVPLGIDLTCKECGRNEVIAPRGGKDEEQAKVVAKIDRRIEQNEIASSKFNYDDSDSFNDSFAREIQRLEALKVFVLAGVDFKVSDDGGTVVVEDKFVYALRSKKWRGVGKSVWYKSRSPSDFIKLYVKKETK